MNIVHYMKHSKREACHLIGNMKSLLQCLVSYYLLCSLYHDKEIFCGVHDLLHMATIALGCPLKAFG